MTIYDRWLIPALAALQFSLGALFAIGTWLVMRPSVLDQDATVLVIASFALAVINALMAIWLLGRGRAAWCSALIFDSIMVLLVAFVWVGGGAAWSLFVGYVALLAVLVIGRRQFSYG